MNIEELAWSLRQMAPEFADSYCIINGELMKLDEVLRMGQEEYRTRSVRYMPSKLYKYFSNTYTENDINYSIQALKDNTVHLEFPKNYDDVFDSEISLEFNEYEDLFIRDYCDRCQIEIGDKSIPELVYSLQLCLHDAYTKSGDLNNAFIKPSDSENEELSRKLFCLRLQKYLNEFNDFNLALKKIIEESYKECSKDSRDMFMASCFTTLPFSQLMWGKYANEHKGFCIEYGVLRDDNQYSDLLYNLLPMIYCKTRSGVTRRIYKYQDHKPDDQYLWDLLSNGLLRKSFDWAFQNEWRLLLPKNWLPGNNQNITFFPITRVYLGNRMPYEERMKIIEICKQKGIPYSGVLRNAKYYEMEACQYSCEDCSICAPKDN